MACHTRRSAEVGWLPGLLSRPKEVLTRGRELEHEAMKEKMDREKADKEENEQAEAQKKVAEEEVAQSLQ